MISPVFEYRLKSSMIPACLSMMVMLPLKPSRMMKAKARGTPEKLLVMLAKALTKLRNLESTRRSE
ncbi:hypothetical protein D3C81_2102030 [compost metagenome]